MPNYCKYYKKKKQYSTDSGTTWVDVVPYEYEKGDLYESYSQDCGVITQYRWVVMSGASDYICSGTTKYKEEKQQVSYDNGQTWADTSPLVTRTGQVMEYLSEDCGYVPSPYSQQYLTFEALDDNTRISFYSEVQNDKYILTISASTNGGQTWRTYQSFQGVSGYTIATLNAGQKVLIKGENPRYSFYLYGGWKSHCSFLSTGRFIAYGNIMSLCYGDLFYGKDIPNARGTFKRLFANSQHLVSAENLVLPQTVVWDCYNTMFSGCTSLEVAPELPAMTLAEGCYSSMFNGCTSLTVAPVLSATSATTNCYYQMFRDCSSLNYIKCLCENPATNPPDPLFSNFQNWVKNVASSGTFVKDANTTWITGDSGIPANWTITDA